ncbi:MAG: A/G-specific adenine glycosylase [Mariprofundus sp.]
MSFTRCSALIDWYDRHGRDLPWRHTIDPYRIWISEIMLQQTQVKTVLPRYLSWFDRFPTIASLAAAPLDDVLKAWEGLGYYRRARFIHQAAIRIETDFSGCFPDDFSALLSLPGIGRSTAGAIASFCFNQPTPVLDGNVKRVLKRWHDQPQAADKALWLLAQQAMDAAGNPAVWNQAMMELGATLCGAKRADCDGCPVSGSCLSAYQVEAAAEKQPPVAVKDVHWQVELHICPQKGIWLCQRPDTGIWAGLWTPPIIRLDAVPTKAPTYIHLLTHRRLHLYSELQEQLPQGDGQWIADLTQLALPTGIHRLLEKCGVTS